MGAFLGWGGRLAVVPRGYLGVEVFFVLTGYFLCQSMSKGNTRILPFLTKKVKVFYPELLSSLAIALCFRNLVSFLEEGKLYPYLTLFANDALLLKMVGIPFSPMRGLNDPAWYLSSMMLATVPLYLYHKFRGAGILLMLAGIALFAGLLWSVDNISNPYTCVHGVCIGNVRALSAMGIGMCAFPAAAWLRKLTLTHRMQIVFTIVKHLLFLLAFAYMLTWIPNNHLAWLILVWGWVVLAMCGQSLGAQVFANTMFCTLGKISLPLFLSHHFYAKYWGAIMPSGTPDWQMATWYLLATGITTAAVMGGALLIRRIVAAFHTPH